jgi:undecaprenyl phosphate-alpha-L-ara4N flippase subunit ArnF
MARAGSNHPRYCLRRTERMKGYLPAIISVILISAAQLLLRLAMQGAPVNSLADLQFFWSLSGIFLICGLSCYLLSFITWIFALRYLPVSRAYPLISLSYVIVWASAIALPWLSETFHPSSLIGIACILAGLVRFYLAPRR